jgi:peptide/nickel transport system substrate-binding protein
VPDSHIQLDINTNYWRASAAKATHPYAGNITSITIKTNDEVNSRILNLKAGTTDAAYWPVTHSDQIWNKVNGSSGDGTLKSKLSDLKLWCQEPTYTVMFLGLNMNPTLNKSGTVIQSPWTIKAMREAASYAFNYQTFITNIVYGFGEQANGPIPRTMFGHNDSQVPLSYDLDKAVEQWNLAMAAGLESILANMSYKMEIYYNSGNTVRERACLLMKDGLNAILAAPTSTKPVNGTLTIDVVALEWANYLYQLQHRQLPIFFLGWAPDFADPDDYVGPFVNSAGTFPKRIGLGVSVGWNSTLVNGWISAAAQTTNTTLREILYGKVQTAIFNHYAYIWCYQAQAFHVESKYMMGYQFNPMWDAYFYHYYKSFAIPTT